MTTTLTTLRITDNLDEIIRDRQIEKETADTIKFIGSDKIWKVWKRSNGTRVLTHKNQMMDILTSTPNSH